MFNFIKQSLGKIYASVTQQLNSLFSTNRVDETTLTQLTKILISADTGVTITKSIINNLRTQQEAGTIAHGVDLKNALEEQLLKLLPAYTQDTGQVYLLVGINGSGKTTCAAKLASRYKNQGKKVLLVAGDTFRAAATEQLQQWANLLGVDILVGKPAQDPASVIFTGCAQYKTGAYDVLIIDTAGRLQTKTYLMQELEKIRRTINKQVPTAHVTTLLTVDAMLGQNSLEQARLFNESTSLSGIILTKMDGTGKGGIAFSIAQELKIPVAYISFGEQPTDLKKFNAGEYVTQLLEL